MMSNFIWRRQGRTRNLWIRSQTVLSLDHLSAFSERAFWTLWRHGSATIVEKKQPGCMCSQVSTDESYLRKKNLELKYFKYQDMFKTRIGTVFVIFAPRLPTISY